MEQKEQTEHKCCIHQKGRTWKQQCKERADPRRFLGDNVGAAARIRERQLAIKSVEKARLKEKEWEELVKQGKARKIITPIVRGYKVSYELITN